MPVLKKNATSIYSYFIKLIHNPSNQHKIYIKFESSVFRVGCYRLFLLDSTVLELPWSFRRGVDINILKTVHIFIQIILNFKQLIRVVISYLSMFLTDGYFEEIHSSLNTFACIKNESI